MLWLFIWPSGIALSAEPFSVSREVRQGYVLRVESTQPFRPGSTVGFLGRTIPLYATASGAYGLMPVSVLQGPGTFPLTIVGPENETLHETQVKVVDAGYLEQNVATTNRMRNLRSSDEETKIMAAFRASTGDKKLWAEPFARPVPECTNSPFGVKRLHDGKPTGNFHAGLDFRSPKGRAVHAAETGVVRVARMFPRQGGTVGLDHGQGVQTTYIHLSKVAAVEGKTVRRGQIIGYVGSTGFSTGAHLHWSVNVHAVPVNPLQWLSGAKACGVR